MVLNLETGQVSPQFHIQHDVFFETVHPGASNPKATILWQKLEGLVNFDGTTANKSDLPTFQDSFQGLREVREQPMNDKQPSEQSADENIHPPIFQNSAQNQENDFIDDIVEPIPETTATPRRSSRPRTMTNRMKESLEQARGNFAYALTLYDQMHEFNYKDQFLRDLPISYLAKTDQDIMYFHQAIKELDRDKFIQAVIKEVNDHIVRKHWDLISRKDVPEGEDILDAVWSMKRKRKLVSREPYKWKACLNIHCGQQEYAVHYFDTYSPVVTWPTTSRLLLTLCLINGWCSRQIDFVLAYPQANIEQDL